MTDRASQSETNMMHEAKLGIAKPIENRAYIRRVPWLAMLLLAIAWTAASGIFMYSGWPTQKLEQEAIPEFPRLEDCYPRDYLECFGAVARHRQALEYVRYLYADTYHDRIISHVVESSLFWAIPLLIAIIFQNILFGKGDKLIVRTLVRTLVMIIVQMMVNAVLFDESFWTRVAFGILLGLVIVTAYDFFFPIKVEADENSQGTNKEK